MDKFAFVDSDGRIYTALGMQDNIDEYGFDYRSISGPEISVKDLHGDNKKAVIAEPVDNIPFMGETLVACFMEIDMQELIKGLSLQTDSDGATFCNLYTSDGVALTDMVLGGLASEDNLLDALKMADFEDGYSLDAIVADFQEGRPGIASFTYNGVQETLDYVPVPNTDWMVTYLIRESVITDRISGISEGITMRSLLQVAVTALVLLVAAGIMVVKSESFSFSKLLEQVNTIISSQCSDKGLEYRCQIIGHVDDGYIGDDTKLRQALINVLGNAVKFTSAGGSVHLEVERTAQFAGKSTLRFTVRDTGIGMDPEFLPHIFDAFSQEEASSANKYGSTGLGLAITKSIVEMMNGTIEVESEKGKGTTFVITVTLGDAENTATDFADVEILPHEMSVLVIDDDPVACEHAKLVLEAAGIAAHIAESGAQAVEMVRLRQARREPYDLILVDWKMPDMDGVETTRQIRSIAGDESAIIILTAYNWDDVLEEALAAGVDSFIAKPLFAANVIDEFQQALKKRNAAGKNKRRVDLAGRRVLLAEDVAVNAEIMIELMKMKQVEVERAEGRGARAEGRGPYAPASSWCFFFISYIRSSISLMKESTSPALK